MTNKHESREPDTKPAVWARSEPATTRFYVGPDRPVTNKCATLGQETSHCGLARHDPFTSKPVKSVFYTKTRFLARFFRTKGVESARLGPLQVEFGQKIKLACLDDPIRFSNHA
jgi:hypothetical protein